MRRWIAGLVVCLLLVSSLFLGCIEDSSDDDKEQPNKPPIADAGEDVVVTTLTEIQFNATNSSDPDGSIVSYFWDFNDPNNPGKDTSTDAKSKYMYNSPGQYTVTLKVTDDDDSNSTVWQALLRQDQG